MHRNFTIDPVDSKTIFIFDCSGGSFYSKSGFAMAKYHDDWLYYQGNNVWNFFKAKTPMVFDTQIEAELACLQYLDFLKECGYAV